METPLPNPNQSGSGFWCQLLLFPPLPRAKAHIKVRESRSPNSNRRILIDVQTRFPRKHGMMLATRSAAALLLMTASPAEAMASQKVLQGDNTRLDQAFESFALGIMQEFHVPGLAIGVVDGDDTWTAVSWHQRTHRGRAPISRARPARVRTRAEKLRVSRATVTQHCRRPP